MVPARAASSQPKGMPVVQEMGGGALERLGLKWEAVEPVDPGLAERTELGQKPYGTQAEIPPSSAAAAGVAVEAAISSLLDSP